LSSLRRRLAALRELRGAREIALFARVSVVAVCVPLLLRLPLPRVAAVLDLASTRPPPARPRSVDRLPELVRIAQQALGPLVRPGCLARGVTLFWFLRRADVEVELCFGVDTLAAEPDGHCWLVAEGEPLFERVDPRTRFAETYRLPTPRR
jgi:sugar phosphate isomerase/epimerase